MIPATKRFRYLSWLSLAVPALIVLAVLILAGCAVMPQTFNQRLVVAYDTVAEVRTQATAALAAKKITPDDAENIQKQADEARKGLDIARVLFRTSPSSADAKLDATRTALVALQAYLIARESK